MRRALACLALVALAGCAHARPSDEALAQIHTGEFRLTADDGQPFELAAHRGHVVVLQFFASWCVPCLAEVNQLKALDAQHRPGLEIVGVQMDLDAERTIRAFRATAGVAYPLLIADDATRAGDGPFGKVPELPTTVVIDPAGRVRSAFIGLLPEHDFDALLAEAQKPK